VGSGRNIPVRQGYLYKKSNKSFSKVSISLHFSSASTYKNCTYVQYVPGIINTDNFMGLFFHQFLSVFSSFSVISFRSSLSSHFLLFQSFPSFPVISFLPSQFLPFKSSPSFPDISFLSSYFLQSDFIHGILNFFN
jgi:hypothetical protein